MQEMCAGTMLAIAGFPLIIKSERSDEVFSVVMPHWTSPDMTKLRALKMRLYQKPLD
jgi:hypothetical protein